MNKNILSLLAAALLITLSLTACATVSESRSNIPVYPRLKPDSGQFEEARRKMVSIEKTALPDKRIEINAYTTDASLNDVLAYYNGALSGWTQTAKNDQGGIYIARWSAGKTKGFAVYYNRNTAGGANIVLLEQFWR